MASPSSSLTENYFVSKLIKEYSSLQAKNILIWVDGLKFDKQNTKKFGANVLSHRDCGLTELG